MMSDTINTNAEAEAEYRELATSLKILSADIVENAGSGHLGVSLGMAEAFAVLYRDFFNHDPANPLWPDRDRLVLSVGHASPLLYGLLHMAGYQISNDDLKKFRKLESRTPGHPEFGMTPGIEATTGLLGQGVGMAAGMALSERLLNARLGNELVDHHTYCIVGDGCMMEGISHEAASLSGHLGLGRLVILFDDNHTTIDGNTDLTVSDDASKRFDSYGWQTIVCDGHNPLEIKAALAQATAQTDRPTLISLRTIIGHGSPSREGTNAAHSGPLGAKELALLKQSLGWRDEPFVIPERIKNLWRASTQRGIDKHRKWTASLNADPSKKNALEEIQSQTPDEKAVAALEELKRQLVEEQPECATRFASLRAIETIRPHYASMIGGAADLTISTFTKPDDIQSVRPGDFNGSHIHYGVREHAMGAIMNGMALHGDVRPYGGTYVCFLDYARPAVRMSAMMGLGVIYVCTHDSIGAGDDGPTHQAVEQFSSLRGMPNIHIMRPADSVETAECWQIALKEHHTPSVLMLSAQGWPATATGLPTLRKEYSDANMSARGAYVLSPTVGTRDLTILATGSEVSIAIEAKELLASKGVHAAVVSMPCWDLFEKQGNQYRQEVLGEAPRIAVEAASAFGWTRYVPSEDYVVGVRTFGISAGWKDLYEHFGLTAKAVTEKALQVLSVEAPNRPAAKQTIEDNKFHK
jgi:transketolase